MDINKYTLDEMKQGFHHSETEKAHICNYCGKIFSDDQVFSIAGNFYVAQAAAATHIVQEHGGNFDMLLHNDTKYNTLTDRQKELFQLFHSGLSDEEIAAELEVSTSTVRHQKFTFRERAKQARLYLAMFEQTFANDTKSNDNIIPIHDHAAYYDQRYVITEQEQEKILQASFISLEPLKLKNFPPKEKKKVVILTKIAGLFEPGKAYTEKEVNQILIPVYEDYPSLRRYLVMYGFMKRCKDGSDYQLT